jgi:hypothetical protein
MYAPFFKGDRVRTRDGRTATVYQDADEYWQTASIEFDSDKRFIIQKNKTDLLPLTEPIPAVAKPAVAAPLDLNLKLTTVDRHTDTSMSVEFWDRDDNQVAVIRSTPAQLQAFALRILQQVQYNLEDREK